MLGLFISMVGRLVVNWGSMVGWGMMDYWGSMVCRGRLVCWSMVHNRGSMVGRGNSMMSYHWGSMDSMNSMRESCEGNSSFTSYQRNKGKESKCLKRLSVNLKLFF